MVLTLLPAGSCRLCWHDLTESNFHCGAVWIGETGIPCCARRAVMPDVCDDCWRAFAAWCRARLGEERRKAQFSDAAWRRPGAVKARDTEMSWEEGRAESRYARFSQASVEEWLVKAIAKSADAIMGAQTKVGQKKARQERAYAPYPKVPKRYPKMNLSTG